MCVCVQAVMGGNSKPLSQLSELGSVGLACSACIHMGSTDDSLVSRNCLICQRTFSEYLNWENTDNLYLDSMRYNLFLLLS